MSRPEIPKRFVEDLNLLDYFVEWLTKSGNPQLIGTLLVNFTATEIVSAFMSTQYNIISDRDTGDENDNG